MIKRHKIAPSYSIDYAEVERPSPMSDNLLEKTIIDVLSGNIDRNFNPEILDTFKKDVEKWILNSNLNNLIGFESFSRVDIISGCTQFIDSLYIDGDVQIIEGDYRYHDRLNRYRHKTAPGQLFKQVPLIIAMPFPQIGAPHVHMEEILNEAAEKNIPVHIDGAWVTCCQGVNFNFSHPAIKSVGISLSKGLGLGWNRIGLRWSKQQNADSITIMNDFNMINKALVMIGSHFIHNFEPDYLWNKHGKNYHKVCNDFNLQPTSSIYLALRDGHPVGITPLLRYLENERV